MLLSKYEVTKVTVIGDDDPLLGDGNVENLPILQTRRVVMSYGCHIVAESSEEDSKAELGALVE